VAGRNGVRLHNLGTAFVCVARVLTFYIPHGYSMFAPFLSNALTSTCSMDKC